MLWVGRGASSGEVRRQWTGPGMPLQPCRAARRLQSLSTGLLVERGLEDGAHKGEGMEHAEKGCAFAGLEVGQQGEDEGLHGHTNTRRTLSWC